MAGSISDFPRFALGFVAVLLLGVGNLVLGSFSRIRHPEYDTSVKASDHLLLYWFSALAVIAVVLLAALDQPGGLAELGIPTLRESNTDAECWPFLLGYLLIFAPSFFGGWVRRRSGRPREANLDPSRPSVAMALQYRDGWQRLAYLSVLPFIVTSEDLVFRGYLILFMASRTAILIPWLVISILLSVVIHLYQGRDVKTIGTHIYFAGLFAGLIIWTHNILIPIGLHLFYNATVTIGIWRWATPEDVGPMPRNRSAGAKLAYLTYMLVNASLLFLAWMLLLQE